MMPTRRESLATWDVFEIGPLEITSAVRQTPPRRSGDLLYEFRVRRDGKPLTCLTVDYHPAIGTGGSYFLEETRGAVHRTLKRFCREPRYEVVKADVAAWLRTHILAEHAP